MPTRLRLLLALLLAASLSTGCDDDGDSPDGDSGEADQTTATGDASPDAGDATTDDATGTTDDATTTNQDATSPSDTSDVATGQDATAPGDATETDTMGPSSGLEARPANPDCVAPERVAVSGPVTWTSVGGGAPNLDLMMMRQTPDGSWFEIYRSGEVFSRSPEGDRTGPHLTIAVDTEGEMGLLGFDLHPEWPATPHLFFYYVTQPDNVVVTIERFTADPLTLGIDGASGTEIFSYDRGQPWNNHVGGSIEFDPLAVTPTLYLATGDGEQQAAVMDPATPHGKLMRIDVSAPPYTPELVGVGLRNPFRWSFDSATGDLWIADVGDADFEEVNFVPRSDLPAAGGTPLNFGWPVMEGLMCRTGSDPATGCGHPDPITLPVNVYDRSVGVSVIGGRVYRGSAIPGRLGHYFFNDIFVQNGEPSWELSPNPNEDPTNLADDWIRTPLNEGGFVGYAEGRDGELYAFTMWGGIYQLGPGNGGPPMESMPPTLSQTGCFDSAGEPTDGLVPFEVQAPLWSDGAVKRRWLALPDGEAMTLDPRGDFEFPNGTVLAKDFTQEGVRVETRLFVRHPDGVWAGYSYAWVGSDGSALADAELLTDPSSVSRPVPGTQVDWSYPSRFECLGCHTEAAGRSLGLEVGQLNHGLTYPSTGITANQLSTLHEVGLLSDDPEAFGDWLLPDYDDTSRPVQDRMWSYLHSNCANCHVSGGPGQRSNMPDVRFPSNVDPGAAQHPLDVMFCNVPAGRDIGLGDDALLVEPGNPGDWANPGAGGSALYLRMAARDSVAGSTGTMPQIGSARVDDVHGLPLAAEWIQGLSCP